MPQALQHRRSSRRLSGTRLVTVAAAASVLLVACTGGDHGGSHSGRGLLPDVRIDPHHPAPAVPMPGAAPGGTVTVLTKALPESLDPTGSYDPVTDAILSSLLTRSLTQYVYEPQRRAMVLVPDLATDTGRPNADFTSWTFTIRSGRRF
jgi:peptide/nickel transport system substrate-binding protein